MRAFPVPVQITDEERLIGGFLSLRQLLYIILGAALGGAAFLLTFIPLLLRLVFFLVLAAGGIGFAFLKVQEMRLDYYLYLYLKWRVNPRELYLEGRNLSG